MPQNRRVFFQESAVVASAALASNQLAAAPQVDSPEKVTMKSFRQKLLHCLGGQWPDPCDLSVRLREHQKHQGFRIESLDYEVEPGDRVPALLLIPDGVSAADPAPAVAVWHQHAGQYHLGKSEPAGLAGNPMHHTGAALARCGYVVLCPDALCFEERQDPTKKLTAGRFERYEFLRYVVDGKCMAWKNILDMRRAVDLLTERPEVQAERIGCYGHSMGSTHTWLVGPWEPRLQCLVGNCCLPTYKGIHEEHLLHCFPNFVPGIYPFGDTPDIAGLIAPRPLLMNFGELDTGSPIDEVRAGVKTIAAHYADAGSPTHFSHYIEAGSGHVLSDEMWKRTRDWFDRHLQA